MQLLGNQEHAEPSQSDGYSPVSLRPTGMCIPAVDCGVKGMGSTPETTAVPSQELPGSKSELVALELGHSLSQWALSLTLFWPNRPLQEGRKTEVQDFFSAEKMQLFPGQSCILFPG